jgi:hypothetical protein
MKNWHSIEGLMSSAKQLLWCSTLGIGNGRSAKRHHLILTGVELERQKAAWRVHPLWVL